MAFDVAIRLRADGTEQVRGAFNGVADGADRVGERLDRLRGMWMQLAGISVFGVGIREVAQLADAYTQLMGRLNMVTGSAQGAGAQFDSLLAIANRMQQPVQEVAQLYLGASRSAQDLGASQQQLTKFTEGVAAALRVSGTSGQAASGALLQLTQMLAGTNVQAQEFNSLVDGAPELLRAVAANVGETGISMGELRARVVAGKMPVREFFDAFLKGSEQLVAQAEKLPPTLGGAFTELQNNLLKLVGQVDKSLGASGSVASAIQGLARMLPSVMEPLTKLLKLFVDLVPVAAAYAAAVYLLPPALAAFTAAKLAATAAMASFSATASLVGAPLAALTMLMSAGTAASFKLAAGFTAVQVSLGVLIAAFAGWQIGGWLRENFLEAELAGIAFVNGTVKGWELVRYSAQVAWAYIGNAWRETLAGMGSVLGWFLDKLGGGLSALGLDDAAARVLGWAGTVTAATRNTGNLSAELDTLRRGYESATAEVDRITGEMADEAIAARRSAAEQRQVGQALQATTNRRKEATEAVKKQAQEYAKLLDGYAKLAEAGARREATAEAELGLSRKLTDAEKDYIKVMSDVRDGKVRLNDLVRTGTLARLQENVAAAQTRQRIGEETRAIADATKARDKHFESLDKETAKITEQARQLEQSNVQTRMSREVLVAQEVAQGRASAARLRDIALIEEQMGGSAALVERWREQASALDRLANAREGSLGARAARDTGSAWADVSKEIGQGLTDSLFRAFESGRGFFKTLWDGIRNTFKTTVLRLSIDAVMRPVQAALSGAVGSLLGMPAAAATGGAGRGAGGALGGIASLFGAAGSTFGGTALAGLTSWTGGLSGVGSMLSAGSTLLGAGNVAAGLGAFAGALGPVALGLMALSSLRHKATPHMGSVVGLDGNGLSTLMGDGSGITNSLSAETDAALRVLTAGSAGALNDLSKAFGLSSTFSGTAKFAADGKDASIGQFILGRDGQILSQVGSGATSLTGGGQYAMYTSDREAAYAAYAQDVARVTRDALAALDLPEWARAEVAKLGANATLDEIAALAANLAERSSSGGATAGSEAADEPAFEPIGRNEMLDEMRLLRERVDLVTAAVRDLTAVNEAGHAGTAAAVGDTNRQLARWDDGDAVQTRAAT